MPDKQKKSVKPKTDSMHRVRSINLGNGKTAQVFAVKRKRTSGLKNVGYVVKIKGGGNARRQMDNDKNRSKSSN
jgi:hypothetical protein